MSYEPSLPYKPGDSISGRYRILREIGRGAHGIVYSCRDLETRGEVAVKFLGQEKSLDPEYTRRLEREALAMAKLRGTNAVYVHALGKDEHGALYLVMEMLHGRDLGALLTEAEAQGGRIKAPTLMQFLRPVVDTLEAAHKLGIVHRDLKPENVFLVNRQHGGGVRLLDFGLAKLLGASALTADGIVAGTPSYIAPEAWAGSPQALDHRIDVYALGVLIFRALAGVTPTPFTNLLDTCRWATTGVRPSLHALRPSLPRAVDPWTEKALAIDPNERYQSVRALFSSFEACFAPGSAQSVPSR